MKLRISFALTVIFASSHLLSQSPAAAPGAVVTGRVILADTDGPARFSKVLLKSTVPDDSNNPFAALLNAGDDEGDGKARKPKPTLSPEEEAAKKKQMAASMKMLSSLSDMLQATTVAADGTYIFTGVKPGVYYVHATAKGYIDPLSQFSDDDLTSKDPAMKKRIAAVATMVTVTAAEGAHADLRLIRGASISGRVLYDDGTPAVGWTVRTVHDLPAAGDNPFAAMGLDASDLDLAHAQEAAITDDTGYYRLSGLPTGDYIVQARLAMAAIGHDSSGNGQASMMSMVGLKLTVYSGDTLMRSAAKPVSVREGESRADYNLTMPLHTMHAIGGSVRAKGDGHPVNAGSIELSALTADGKEEPGMHFVTQVRPDGSFHFDYLPGPESYSLKVTGALDQTVTGTAKVLGTSVPEKHTTHSYGPATIPVQIGDSDVTDLKVDVPERAVAQ